jgi:hypothetical protein
MRHPRDWFDSDHHQSILSSNAERLKLDINFDISWSTCVVTIEIVAKLF